MERKYKPYWIVVEYTMPGEEPLYWETMRIWAYNTNEAKQKGCIEIETGGGTPIRSATKGTKLYNTILNGE